MKKSLLLIPLLTSYTACGTLLTPNPMQKGHIALIADAEGMRAFSDMTTGLVTEAKTPKGVKGAYWQHRDTHEVEQTKRDTSPSLLDSLFTTKKVTTNDRAY